MPARFVSFSSNQKRPIFLLTGPSTGIMSVLCGSGTGKRLRGYYNNLGITVSVGKGGKGGRQKDVLFFFFPFFKIFFLKKNFKCMRRLAGD
jgi:hypothetical protein